MCSTNVFNNNNVCVRLFVCVRLLSGEHSTCLCCVMSMVIGDGRGQHCDRRGFQLQMGHSCMPFYPAKQVLPLVKIYAQREKRTSWLAIESKK